MGVMERYEENKKKKQNTSDNIRLGVQERHELNKLTRDKSYEVNQDFINSFISDANNFLGSAEEEYGNAGWANASSVYDTRYNSFLDLYSKSTAIRRWLDNNKNNLDAESYSELSEAIDSVTNGVHSVTNSFKSKKDYFSQWDNEDAYNEYARQQKEIEDILNSADLEQHSQMGATVENPTWEASLAPLNIGGWKPFGDGEKINNVVTFAEANKSKIALEGAQNFRGGGGVDERSQLLNRINEYMSPEEKSVYNYYIGKGDISRAEEYLSNLDNTLKLREAGDLVEFVGDSKALQMAFAAAAGLDQFASGIKNIDNYFKGTEGDPVHSAQYASQMIREDLDGAWGVAYDLTSTTANMLPSILVSYIPVVGQAAGLVTMGASATGNAYAEMRNLGYDANQARTYATLVGASEATLQKIMGGIGKLGGVSKYVSKFASKLDNALARIAIRYGINVAAEGLEEGIQTAIEPVFKSWATGEDFEAAEWDDILYSALLGSLSAGFLEGAPTALGAASIVSSNIDAKKTYGSGADLVTEAIEVGGDAKVLGEKYQKKLDSGKELSGGQINNLLGATDTTIRSEDTTKIRNEILKKLGEYGETTDVTPIADVLVKYATGEKLTSRDYSILNNSDKGHLVLSELNKANIQSGGLANDWASHIGTKRISIESYNKDFVGSVKARMVDREDKEKDAASKTIDDAVNAKGEKFDASDSGKTIYKDAEGNHHEVTVNKVVSTKDGLKVELDDGKTVSAKDLTFGSESEALMYEMVARMDVSPDTATEFVKTFKPTNDKQAAVYFSNVPLAYKYGTINYEAGLKNVNMPEIEKRIAFNRGKADAIAKAKQNTTTAPKSAQTAKTENSDKTGKNGIVYEDGFTYDEATANEMQKVSMAHIEVIDQISNLEVHIFESKVENGKRVAKVNGKLVSAPNGYFKDDNKIYIDFASGNNGEGAMLHTMSHEISHYIRKWNEKGFKELGDFLIEQYGKKGVPVNALIEDQKAKIKKRYSEEGKALPNEAKLFDMAYEELVADAMSDMLTDPKAYEKLMKLKQKNHSLWAKLGEAIKAILDKFKSALGIYKTMDVAVANEAFEVRGFTAEAYEKLQDLYIKAFVEADANYEASIGTRDLNDFAEAKNENGETLLQYRAMEADEAAYREMLYKWGKMSSTQIDNLFKTIDNAMEIIKDNLEVLDYAWEADIDDRAFSPVKPNSDKLYQVSLDFSTLCRKRLLQQTVQAQLQEALNKPLTREEGIAIRDALIALQEEGRQIEVACALCYVESARMKSPEQIKRFIENKEKVIKEFFAGKSGGNIKQKIRQAEADARARLGVGNTSLKNLPGKVAQEIRDAKKAAKESYKPTAEEQELISVANKMTVSDFTSPEGLENLAKKYPRLFDAYTSYVRNATKSKGIEGDTWWRAGDSARIGDVLIANMNKENGLRTQSWSDFQVIHILDYIASTIELATRNTKEQAYSKVPDYVELMGLTGVMINMSLIPTATFNGSLEYDSVEGIDYKRALELRDKYHATAGTICIGVDNAQIRLLLADIAIDYVIPYHKSGMSKALRKLMHLPTWSDYESYQSESNLSRAEAEKQAKKYGVKLLDASDPNYQKGTSFSDWFDLKEAQQIAKMENANPSDKAKQKQYGIMYGGYMAMQNAANNYLKLCAERGLSPKFSNEKADFTAEANYWKLLIDRKMVDNVTGEVIEQQTIKPIFNEGEVLRILNDELARYPKVKADQDYAIRTVTEKMLSGEVKGGMSAEAIAKAMKKPVDNVTNVNILASSEDMMLSDRTSNAVEEFGYTPYFSDAGYLLANGKMLNFSGAKDKHIGMKGLDHRAIGRVYDGESSSKAMLQFMNEGNVRIKATSPGIDLGISVEPTTSQYNTIARFIYESKKKGRFYVDFTDVNGKPIGSLEYDGTIDTEEILYDIKDYFKTGKVRDQSNDYLYSDRTSYAPTFYSHMGKVIDDIRIEKMGAGGVVSYLKGKGVKDEEIKWSGIEAFLEGKKSVTKAELQEFVAGSQLQIVEQMSNTATFVDEDGNTYTESEFKDKAYAMAKEQDIDRDRVKFVLDPDDGSYVAYAGNRFSGIILEAEADSSSGTLGRWGDYKLEGGSNYRELVFQLPNSSYSNSAMRVHWGEDAEGVLAHARIQDFDVDGKKMLFIEEIQSDWHNEGAKDGYYDSKDEARIEKLKATADEAFLKVEDYSVAATGLAGEWETIEKTPRGAKLIKEYREAKASYDKAMDESVKKIPDAPFRNTYHEYVLKRLLRMAAEEGYDSIGWTPSGIQSKRWSEEFAEAYRIEYDQDIPKFLRKYGKKWGATVGTATVANTDVWSMDITGSMKDSVLNEGQVLYSDRNPYSYDALISKDELEVKELTKLPEAEIEKYQKDTSLFGKDMREIAASVKNQKNTSTKTYLHCRDLGADVLITKDSFKHGAARMDGAYILICKNIATVLNNSIVVNELKARGSTNGGYVLLGMVETDDSYVVVRSLVNKRTWKLEEYEELDAIKKKSIKKEDVGLKPPNYIRKNGFGTSSVISIADFLGFVNSKNLANSVLSLDVIEKLNSNRGFDENVTPNLVYSDRDPNAVSNRTLLAHALEGVAQNDVEKNKLAQYKAKIALIESEQAKLSEIRAKIKELSFAKGARDTEQLKSLQFEANQTANRINTYDRQLLNLESTKALKDVLEREKAMAYKKAEQRGKEALKRQREKDAETKRELLTRYQESRKNAIEGRHKTEMRHKIKSVVSDLNKLLLHPTKEQHVPIGLQLPVAEALDAINMDTMNAGQRVEYYNNLIAKSNDPDEIAMLTKKRDFFEYRDANFKERITALKNAYAEFKTSDDPLIRNAHNEAIEDLIKNTADAVGNKSLKDMSFEQLESVYRMYKAILATVKNSNKMFKEGRQATVTENSEAVKTEVREVGGHKDRVLKISKFLKKFGWSMLKPVTAMKVIGSKTFSELFANVRAGEDTWAVDVSEAKQFYEDISSKHGFKKWDFKKRFSFKDSTGTDFSLSLEQIMSLYAYSKRDQADRHLEVGGFIFDDAIEVTEKGKFGIPMKYEVNDANPYRLKKEDLAPVIDALSSEQKAFVDAMQTYLSDVMGAKGNEVSLAMYDIKLYNETNYFPLKTSRYFREFDPEKSGTPKIKNSGFSKKTVPQAGNPIVLSNFMDVWATHVNDMSMYHAFVLPLEDFLRVYNYSSTAGGYDSVQQYIKNAYGSQANQYIEKLMDDLNGGARVDASADIINKGISLFKKASVFASASVTIQQPSALARALAYVNPKYFIASAPSALNLVKHKAMWNEVKKYAPVAIIKEMGYFDTGIGRSTVDWIKGNQNIKDKVDDVLSKAPAIADELSWTYLWEAIKRETKATTNLKVGSEEFLKKCGERFTEVITNTQVYDSVLSRSGMMRSKDTGMRMATAFMAEPTTTVNMMVDGIVQGKRGNKKFTAATIGAVSSSIILNSLLVSLVYAARDDDEDETYAEKYVESLTSELIDGFNPLTYIPIVKDAWSLLQGFDVERADMTLVTKLVDSLQQVVTVLAKDTDDMTEDELDEYRREVNEAVLSIIDNATSLMGIPVKNIRRDINAVINTVKTFGRGDQTTASGLKDAVGEAAQNAIPVWGWLPDEKKTDKLYEAIASGDEVYVERIKNTYKSEDAYESAVRKALKDNDPRIHEAAQARLDGDISKYTRIAKEIIAEGNFSQDTVVGAINAEMSAIEKGESTETNPTEDKDEATSIYKASDINAAFDNGDTSTALEIIDDLVNTKVANGKTEKEAKSSVRSSMTSYWKPLYKEAYQSGDTSEMARIRQILFSSGLYGTANEVVKTVQNWLKD